ncbi:hypothetical protein TVAG_019830 [Trichomonas vaginalis G3]|uniref:DUF3447 domain-containing protein n=1 Tax=Trichomonas vaginalis (strain ATCC PRA-98 / G3) TaxID=412133 RepID=A2DX55_TRIV3|nr:spectrin binding [Trichomonas vaginalis G3]EAY15082.1 hypothetical protein TVAG_019830 [Trichomonas vaginalis G3]KAI5549648.1 spectrin binding [Trichomonas vaginalis G3]|eukprot:XP_001327305.1 hypothetical protein [Trichomonas vaginalis G3]
MDDFVPEEHLPIYSLIEHLWIIDEIDINDILKEIESMKSLNLISDRALLQILDCISNERPKFLPIIFDLFHRYFQDKPPKITPDFLFVSDSFKSILIQRYDLQLPIPFIFFGKDEDEILSIYPKNTMKYATLHDDIGLLVDLIEKKPKDAEKLIDLCAQYGSIHCFKYLYMNGHTPTLTTMELSFIGNNFEIINILEQKFTVTQICMDNAVFSHNNELAEYMMSKYGMSYSWHSCLCGYNLSMFYQKLSEVCDANELDHKGISALYSAAQSCLIPLCAYLLDKGADVNCRNASGETPVFAAVSYDNNEMFDYLISKNCDCNTMTKNGISCLMIASYDSSLELIKKLVEHGADTELRDLDGSTPLMIAARFDKPLSVKLLLDLGADVSKEDDSHRTAFNLACNFDSTKSAAVIADFLSKKK